MRRARWIIVVLASAGCAFAVACSGDDSSENDAGNDASNDTTQQDVNKPDSQTNDAQTSDASDAGDAGCPAAWLEVSDASMLWPDGGLPALLLHASGAGSQDYTCEPIDGGYAWTFIGPEANLDDCTQTLIGHHFASEAGAAAPEWQTLDQSFVIGKKLLAYTPDGGQNSVPWLLVQATSNGGNGTIAKTLYVQRLNTDGGNAPSTTCDDTDVDATTKVPYTADATISTATSSSSCRRTRTPAAGAGRPSHHRRRARIPARS